MGMSHELRTMIGSATRVFPEMLMAGPREYRELRSSNASPLTHIGVRRRTRATAHQTLQTLTGTLVHLILEARFTPLKLAMGSKPMRAMSRFSIIRRPPEI